MFRMVDRLRQPEYTGPNRCVPCTALNLVIAAVVSVLLAVAWVPVGIAAFVFSIGIIHIRGYLVPGTPTITSRYFPDRVLRLFDKGVTDGGIDVESEVGAEMEEQISVDLESALLRSGVIEACEDVEDICLTDGFRESWTRRTESIREAGREKERRLLAESMDVDEDALELSLENKGRLAVKFEGDRVASWTSHAAFLADLAAEKELEIWCEAWDTLGAHNRSQMLASLRVFIEECPACGGVISPIEDNVDSCCRKNLVNVTLECEDCGDVVFEGSYK